MKVLKNILYYLTIFILAILLSDACPDFSDHYLEDSKAQTESCSRFKQVIQFLVIEVLNFQHNSSSHHCTSECYHSIEFDVFIPATLMALKALTPLPFQTPNHHQSRLNQIFIDVIPLPPSIFG